MDFLQTLQTTLKTDARFISQEGILLKPKIVDAATSLDPKLIRLLLNEPTLKSYFFTEIDDIFVFDKEKFQWIINSKEFLPDSYTKYRNNIGLSSNDHDLISASSEVTLVWPYKDCVLEGGQDKEDEKRDEIFYNETLAPDEIGRLLAPKAFKNAVRYTADGKQQIGTFSEDDNLIIKGNNLLALTSLLERYEGKVKCIYIDPPYYFRERKSDSFKYNSDFKLSTWLSFMRNRLEQAKHLLQKNGTIWIHIGEDGMHYLKVMADSIFGAEHFIGTLPRRQRAAKSDVPFNFSQDFDWILIYSLSAATDAPIGRKIVRKYYSTPDFPNRPWRLADLRKQTTAKERPNSYFTMVDPKNGKEYPASEKRTWAISADNFQDYYNRGYIVFPDDYDFLNISAPMSRKFKDEDDKKGKLSAVISDFQIKDFLSVLLTGAKNTLGSSQISAIFNNDDTFSYPKPEELMEAIIDVSTQKNDLVLDFFVGSGTTATTAHKMGRRYIGVEQMDYVETVTVPRLQKVIVGEQGGISKAQGWHGGGSFVYVELAEKGEQLMEQLKTANDATGVHQVLDEATKRGLLRPSVLPSELKQTTDDFDALSLDEQKQVVAELIDKNRLYVNAADMDDADTGLSEADKSFTQSFYNQEAKS